MARVLIIVAFLILGSAGAVFAQGERPRLRAAGIFGSAQTWDDEGSLGKGVAAGGRAEWRLFGNTGIEGAVDAITHDRSGGFFEAEGTSFVLSASLVHRFGDARAQPYLLEGIHLLHHDGEVRFDGRTSEATSTNPGLHFGGGLSFRAGERFEIGPEVRLFLGGIETDSEPAWVSWFGIRVGIRR